MTGASRMLPMMLLLVLPLGYVSGQDSDSQSPPVIASESSSPVVIGDPSESSSPANVVIASESSSPANVLIASESSSPAIAVIASESSSPAAVIASESSSPAAVIASESSSPAAVQASDSPSDSPSPVPSATESASQSPAVSPSPGKVIIPIGTLPNPLPVSLTFSEGFIYEVPFLDVNVGQVIQFTCDGTLNNPTNLTVLLANQTNANSEQAVCNGVTVQPLQCDGFSVTQFCTYDPATGRASVGVTVIPLVSASGSPSPVSRSQSPSPQSASQSPSPASDSVSPSPQTPSPVNSQVNSRRQSPVRFSRAQSRASKGVFSKIKPIVSKFIKNSPNRKPEHGKEGENKPGNNDNKNNNDKKDSSDNKKKSDNNKKESEKKNKKSDRTAEDVISGSNVPEYSTSADSSNSAYYAFLAIIPVAAGLIGFIWWRARATPMETTTLEYVPKV